jgi:septum formation protein
MAPHRFIYLASASPRRRQLLDQLGVEHRPLLASRDENIELLEELRSGESPQAYVTRVAVLKLEAARRRLLRRGLPVAPIVCADTTVALGRRILGKPADDSEAAQMLRALSGRTHRVLTAVVVGAAHPLPLELSVSRVRFAALSEGTIRRYVDSGEPRGKAGAYAVQGRIAAWIEHLDGSYSGVMGLPLFETRRLLAMAGVLLSV